MEEREIGTMTMQNYIDNYNSKVSEQEIIFRDLFGKEELQEVKRKAFTQTKSYLEYLREETERKLKQYD